MQRKPCSVNRACLEAGGCYWYGHGQHRATPVCAHSGHAPERPGFDLRKARELLQPQWLMVVHLWKQLSSVAEHRSECRVPESSAPVRAVRGQ